MSSESKKPPIDIAEQMVDDFINGRFTMQDGHKTPLLDRIKNHESQKKAETITPHAVVSGTKKIDSGKPAESFISDPIVAYPENVVMGPLVIPETIQPPISAPTTPEIVIKDPVIESAKPTTIDEVTIETNQDGSVIINKMSDFHSENTIAHLRQASAAREAAASSPIAPIAQNTEINQPEQVISAAPTLAPEDATQLEALSQSETPLVDVSDSSRRPGESLDVYAERLDKQRNEKELEPTTTNLTETNINTGKKHGPTSIRRKFLQGAGAIVLGITLGLGVNGKLPTPDLEHLIPKTESSMSENPFHIGEGEPRNGTLQLNIDSNGNVHEDLASILSESIGWIPDGRSPYITVKNNKGVDERVYVFGGGQGNGSYTVRTDGKTPLRETLLQKEIKPEDIKQILGPEMSPESKAKYESKGIYYLGITTLLQLDKNDPNHVIVLYHGENRTDRNASGTYNAFIGWGESKDGLQTVEDKGVLITGVDTKPPGFYEGTKPDGSPNYRVTGAGQPAGIYNPESGFIQIGFVQWMANEGKSNDDPSKVKDQIDGARIRPTSDGSLDTNSLEFFTTNGWSKTATKETIKPIIGVKEDVADWGYSALPSFFWSTSLNRFVATGESNVNFWYSLSNGNDFSSWTAPEELYSFTKPVLVDDPENFLDPVDPITHTSNFKPFTPGARPSPNPSATPIISEPRNVLPVGKLWESYPMPWDLNETYTSSDVVGGSFTLLHSIGLNQLGHQPGFSYGTIQAK